MTQRSLPNTVSTAWTYNSMGFLNVMSSTKGGVEFDHRLYERANDGTLARETSNGVVTNYYYDDLYRLTSAAITGGTTSSWTYDNVGNRLSQVAGGVTTSYTYNAANRLLTVNGAAVTSNANGSVTAYGSDTYTWDVRNRLKSEVHGGITYQFGYDDDDLRTKKTVGATITDYLLEGGSVVKETTSGVAKHTLQSPALDQPLMRDGKWFVPAQLGSTAALTDGAGVIAQTYGYTAYGELTASVSDPNPFQFTGRENDGTGLMYYRARYYAPQWGRFLSEDPIGFEGGINQYAYCGNNPVNSTDASGKQEGWIPYGPPYGMDFGFDVTQMYVEYVYNIGMSGLNLLFGGSAVPSGVASTIPGMPGATPGEPVGQTLKTDLKGSTKSQFPKSMDDFTLRQIRWLKRHGPTAQMRDEADTAEKLLTRNKYKR
jgi:RHS repeat-associated protein